MHTVGNEGMWIGFFIFIALMLFIDMFLLGGKEAHKVSTRESLIWVLIWISLALIFNLSLWGYLWFTTTPQFADEKALEFFTGYLIEKSLSIDNMFVFLMFFNHFEIPSKYQRRILLYGVLGAIVMRLMMILSGLWLVQKFEWVLLFFGALLVLTGIRMFLIAEKSDNVESRKIVKWIYKHFKVTKTIKGDNFFIVEKKELYITPLFLTLVMIEFSDLIFAIDSIPAILAITQDPFIVFTSNIFAILGLRSLYFLLANMAERFYYLKYALAFILVFIGTKMLIAPWVEVPIVVALVVIALSLLSSIIFSLVTKKLNRRKKARKG